MLLLFLIVKYICWLEYCWIDASVLLAMRKTSLIMKKSGNDILLYFNAVQYA